MAAALSLLLTACDATARLDGTRWLAEYIDGQGVIDDAQTTLEFKEPRQAVGRGGCNRYSVPVAVSGSQIKFGDTVATRMACVAALMDQEFRFHAALRGVSAYRLQDQKLQLLDDAGKVRVSLSPLDAPKN